MRLEFKPDMSGYDLVLCRDLFGVFILYRQWFGLNNHRGGLKQQVFDDRDDALRTINALGTPVKRMSTGWLAKLGETLSIA